MELTSERERLLLKFKRLLSNVKRMDPFKVNARMSRLHTQIKSKIDCIDQLHFSEDRCQSLIEAYKNIEQALKEFEENHANVSKRIRD